MKSWKGWIKDLLANRGSNWERWSWILHYGKIIKPEEGRVAKMLYPEGD